MADTGQKKRKHRKTERRVSVLTPASPALERCASNVAVTVAAVRRTWKTVDMYNISLRWYGTPGSPLRLCHWPREDKEGRGVAKLPRTYREGLRLLPACYILWLIKFKQAWSNMRMSFKDLIWTLLAASPDCTVRIWTSNFCRCPFWETPPTLTKTLRKSVDEL